MAAAFRAEEREPNTGMRKQGQASIASGALLWLMALAQGITSAATPGTSEQSFDARGVVRQVEPAEGKITIAHEAIPKYMAAMTMPFALRETNAWSTLQAGDLIGFRLHVTEYESWIDHIEKLGHTNINRAVTETPAPPKEQHHPLLDYAFTNELGQPVRLNDFHGQALAITFFFTRCPIPDYCPRLNRNFEEASKQLSALPHGRTNWHFISVTFDPAHDSPAILKAYARNYRYDPAHWSFVTGPTDKIEEFARLSGVTFAAENGSINHNFRTEIIDAAGHLQMVFPIGGDLSAALVTEMLKAAAVTNRAP